MENHTMYVNGDIRMDERTKEVTVLGTPIPLTPREYRLLRTLLVNKGRVLSREKLLNMVWGFDAYVVDRNVDVYIGYLRNKLRKALKRSFIKTLPTFGYMMEDLNGPTSRDKASREAASQNVKK